MLLFPCFHSQAAINHFMGCLSSLPPFLPFSLLSLSLAACLITGGGDFKSPEQFKLSLPQRTNYLYGRITKSLPEMYAFTLCMWIKSSATPGIGTPFSYGVPGQANEIVLIEWGNNPIELLINDKVNSFWFPKAAKLVWLYDEMMTHKIKIPKMFPCRLTLQLSPALLYCLYHSKTVPHMCFYVSKPQLGYCILTTGCPVAFGGT